MADNIDFGDPINFSPLQKTPSTAPGMDVSRGAMKDPILQTPRAVAPAPVKPAPSAAPHIQREPAHAVKNIAPLFPRSQGVPAAPAQPMQPNFDGTPPLTPEAAMHPEAMAIKKRNPVVLIGIVLLVVLILGGGGYFVFTLFNKKANNTTTNTTNQTNQATNTVTNTTNTTNVPTVNDPTGDPDGDALTNQEEARYGTDPNNPDSDGDGFKDGAEVEKGFNPLGAGKLQNPQP